MGELLLFYHILTPRWGHGGRGWGRWRDERNANKCFFSSACSSTSSNITLAAAKETVPPPQPPEPPQPHPPSKSSLGEEGRAELALSLDPLQALVRALGWGRDACASSPPPALHASSSRRAHRRHLAGPFTGPITGWRLLALTTHFNY